MNKILLPLLSLLLINSPLANATSSLLIDIKKAQQTLNKTQANISKQSQTLNRQTQQAEQTVLSLRKKTSAARRLVDEQTLSLNTLEKRLKTWQQQNTYQRNLIARFTQQQKLSLKEGNPLADNNLSQLSLNFATLRQAITPQWQQRRIIAQDGIITSQNTLTLGPVSWFLNDSQAGFITDNDGQMSQGLLLDEHAFEALSKLSQGQAASITFDPTLTRALKIAQSKESVVSHVEKGGIWVLPILAFGAFALLISVAKGIQLLRLPKQQPAMANRLSHVEVNDQHATTKLVNQVQGMQQQLVKIALETPAGQQRDDQLFSTLLQQKHQLEYWLGAVAITAAVSPLLGLLGTVSGMIETFKLMTLFGAGDASAVSGGISEALVTTELGLVVAIPALLMHALLSRKVKSYYSALESCAVELSQVSHQPLTKAA